MTIIIDSGILPRIMCIHRGIHHHQVILVMFTVIEGVTSTSFGPGAQEEGDDDEEDNNEGDESDD